jgi:hypothetical protein
MESLGLTMAWKLGLHPSTLAGLISIVLVVSRIQKGGTSFLNQGDPEIHKGGLQLSNILCYLCLLWRD